MKIDSWILPILDNATKTGNTLQLADQLPRAEYVAVVKVIEAAGGKWNRKAAAHVFAGDAAAAIEPILLTGEVTRAKQEFGFFETPAPVVHRIMQLADIRGGHRVLEPSAGRGAIALAAAPRCAALQCFEILHENAVALAKLPGISGLWRGDFLAALPSPIYDRVVMNPPFAAQADIDHVEHAAKFLRPGGRLVSVMSAGIRFRRNRKTEAFRAWLAGMSGEIEDLPPDSFRESGTSVNAVIVTWSLS